MINDHVHDVLTEQNNHGQSSPITKSYIKSTYTTQLDYTKTTRDVFQTLATLHGC
jgi:hypothetical protein